MCASDTFSIQYNSRTPHLSEPQAGTVRNNEHMSYTDTKATIIMVTHLMKNDAISLNYSWRDFEGFFNSAHGGGEGGLGNSGVERNESVYNPIQSNPSD
jgi:hypothetical protein